MIVTKVWDKTRKLFWLYSSMLGKRDGNLYVFGAWYGDKFGDNPRYMYLHLIKNKMRAVWITKNPKVYEEMRKEHLPVLMADTEKAVRYTRRAKYIFYCCSLEDIPYYHAGGAVLINFWHGLTLKKIMYDDTYNYNTGKESLYQRLVQKVIQIPYAKEYVVSTSDEITRIYQSAFRKDRKHILQLGQPRNDCFYDGSIPKRKYKDIEYDKLIVYMPTHRNMGKDVINIPEILDLKRLDDFCRQNRLLFLFKKHYCHKDEYTDLTGCTNIVDYTQKDVDAQELLYNADILVTDYSSCYIDYLLLERPVVFYCYDYEHYIMNDREMYFPYEEATPGPKARNFDELMAAITECLAEDYPYMDEVEDWKDLFYAPENQGPVAEKILREVRKLH